MGEFTEIWTFIDLNLYSLLWVYSLYQNIVLYMHACCIIVTWWGEPGEIESYLDV